MTVRECRTTPWSSARIASVQRVRQSQSVSIAMNPECWDNRYTAATAGDEKCDSPGLTNTRGCPTTMLSTRLFENHVMAVLAEKGRRCCCFRYRSIDGIRHEAPTIT
jgi:hypothetical protein